MTTGNKIDDAIERLHKEIEAIVRFELTLGYRALARDLRESADAIEKSLDELQSPPQSNHHHLEPKLKWVEAPDTKIDK